MPRLKVHLTLVWCAHSCFVAILVRAWKLKRFSGPNIRDIKFWGIQTCSPAVSSCSAFWALSIYRSLSHCNVGEMVSISMCARLACKFAINQIKADSWGKETFGCNSKFEIRRVKGCRAQKSFACWGPMVAHMTSSEPPSVWSTYPL
jgi:hypothetical protein